jgi:hypothetical protein
MAESEDQSFGFSNGATFNIPDNNAHRLHPDYIYPVQGGKLRSITQEFHLKKVEFAIANAKREKDEKIRAKNLATNNYIKGILESQSNPMLHFKFGIKTKMDLDTWNEWKNTRQFPILKAIIEDRLHHNNGFYECFMSVKNGTKFVFNSNLDSVMGLVAKFKDTSLDLYGNALTSLRRKWAKTHSQDDEDWTNEPVKSFFDEAKVAASTEETYDADDLLLFKVEGKEKFVHRGVLESNRFALLSQVECN